MGCGKGASPRRGAPVLALLSVLLAAGGGAPFRDPPVAGAAAPRPAHHQDPARPNILVIVTDDQRADGTLAVMPKTRRWFEQGGTRFSQAFVTTPLCCPSRASVLSGRYAHNHGVRNNRRAEALDQEATLPYHLGKAGYQTAMAGKFLLFWDLSKPPPYFDRYAVTHGTSYHGDWFNVDGRRQRVDEYSTHYIGRRARLPVSHVGLHPPARVPVRRVLRRRRPDRRLPRVLRPRRRSLPAPQPAG